MKHHITKVIAVVVTVAMLVSLVPASVLPTLALAVDSDGAVSSIFDNVVLGKNYVTNTESYAASPLQDAVGNAVVNNTLSPYEPYATEDESHPFLPGNEAWMDLSKIYYGAPATPNTPTTKWSANTSVVNITGTGKTYGADNGVMTGKEIYAVHDMNLIDEYLWADGTREIGDVQENGVASADGDMGWLTFYCRSDEEYIFYAKSSNAVLPFEYVPKAENSYDGLDAGNEIEYIGTDNVVESQYVTSEKGDDGITRHYYKTQMYKAVEKKADAKSAYVYNRYDAMQGKWGLTLDKNVSTVTWIPTWANHYYGTNKPLNNSILYLSDTPYLYYSTEAPDSTKMAISLLIGVKTQNELRTDAGTNLGQTTVTQNSEDRWEYRWYTITDNQLRPGIDPTPNDGVNETLDYSMIPNVYKSGTVAQDVNQDVMAGASEIMAAIKAKNANGMDPLAVAAAEGKNTEELYVDGSITGCIDFTQLLPTLMGVQVDGTSHDSGREDIQYKIVQVRVDTKTAAGEDNTDSAARINYLYFGPGQAAVYTPQSTEGHEVIGANWMWAQNEHGFGDGNPNNVAKWSAAHFFGNATGFDGYDAGYTNGWENGMAVSITNTPNDPQKMTIDTYGQGNGQLITYDQYSADMVAAGKTEGSNETFFTKGSTDVDEFDSDGNVKIHSTYGVKQLGARIWKYTDANGNTQYLEAEYNDVDGEYYIMVSVPIRKWVNVLGDSRKISFAIDVLQYGKTANYDATGTTYTLSDNTIDPTFCMWGNNRGSLGMGHSKVRYGARYRSEDMLAVFGDGYYHVDCSDNYHSAEIDKTLGNSLFYDGSDCWFDILRSPYVYDHTVTTANDQCNYGDEMIGYTYVTTIRYAVPIGCKFTVQNMKGDGNSAGLNSYSATGNIVSAFDGGTGVQPEIIVDDALTEKKTVVTGDATNGYTYTVSENGTLNGTQSSGAAAYGPMLRQSYYTIYDLLDTELINSLDKDSHHKNYTGKEQMTVYGQMWYSIDGQLPIYATPESTARIYGYTYSTNHEFPIYATVKFTDEDNDKWGITGVVLESGTVEVGYVLLWDGSAGKAYAKAGAGVLYKEESTTRSAFSNWSYPRNLSASMKNEWVLSNFIGNYSNFQDANKADIAAYHGSAPLAKDIYSANYGGTQFMFANMWRISSYGGSSTYKTLKDSTFRAVNNTEMQVGFTRKNNTSQNWSIGMTRTFDTPIILHSNSIHNSYPVFYYDYTANDTISNGSDSNAFALSLRVDGTDYLYYLDGEGDSATKELVPEVKDGADGNVYGYFNFKDIMTKTFPGKTVEVVGISMYFWRAASANISNDAVTIRRMEIWQEETDWLDEIISEDSSMTSHVYDSMNIINDAYFYAHNEDTDGSYTISRVNNDDGTAASYDRTNIGINEQLSGYKFTDTDNTKSETVMLKPGQTVGTANGGTTQMEIKRTTSYRKTNSNKGWSARISTDTNLDGLINEKDTTYYSKNFDSEASTGVENVFEYRTALGHLRVWVPAGKQASVVFEADRSFNVNNYKYLYYSYSMRDVESGISAEDKSADGKGSGISVAIKTQQNTSENAYIETDGSWMYFPDGSTYWSDQGQADQRQFSTTMNAALDLSTLDIEAVNQFVFYLNNAKEADPDDPSVNRAEFYINYLYLSNVPPTDLIENELEQTQMQYYYLMDNTGDRYSARFPTIDNPTGQVTGENSDNDRVNPVKVVRGEYLSDGTYFNGDPIYGYGTTSLGTTLDKTTGSLGKYEKTYGATDGFTGSMKNIMFYAGESNDLDDITDYYQYKDTDGNGEATIYDMFWSYGRWYQSSGETGMNIMYVGDPNAPDSEKEDPNYRYDAISGALTRRYATENYVLLRAGIEPKKFPTYFDANDGEFIYVDSSDEIANLQAVTENSYFMDENVILSYFDWPELYDYMTPSVEDENGNKIIKYVQKPGYTFQYWQHCKADGTADTDFNESDIGAKDQLLRFIKKQDAKADYFKAVWKKNDGVKNTTATFYATTDLAAAGENHISQLTTNIESDGGNYELTIPSKTYTMVDGSLKRIYGWYKYDESTGAADKSKVYMPSDKLYVTEDTKFVPETSADEVRSLNIKVYGGKLYVHTTNGQLHTVETHGVSSADIKDKNGNVIGHEYSGAMSNYLLRVIPDEVKTGGIWTSASETNGYKEYIAGAMTILSDNNQYYEFTALQNISITYSTPSVPAYYTDQNSVFVTTSSLEKTDNDSREVAFYSQYDVPDSVTFVASGTLITKSDIYAGFKTTVANKDTDKDGYVDWDTNKNGTIDDDEQAALKDAQLAYIADTMHLDHGTINDTTVANKSYSASSDFRLVQATTANSYGEYILRVTGLKNQPVQYYARAYVIYKDGTGYKVAYGDVVAIGDELPAKSAA